MTLGEKLIYNELVFLCFEFLCLLEERGLVIAQSSFKHLPYPQALNPATQPGRWLVNHQAKPLGADCFEFTFKNFHIIKNTLNFNDIHFSFTFLLAYIFTSLIYIVQL